MTMKKLLLTGVLLAGAVWFHRDGRYYLMQRSKAARVREAAQQRQLIARQRLAL